MIYQFLSTSYWSKGIPESVVRASIDGSMCFGIYHQDKQVGFARMITDKATFGYLADVFVIEQYRGQGLSKRLMKFIIEHPDVQRLRRIVLATADAHELYRQYGFTELNDPGRFMHLYTPDIYNSQKNVAESE